MKITKDDKDARNIAWAIAKKIGKEGTKPSPYFQPVIDSGFVDKRLVWLANRAINDGLKKAGL